MRVSVCLASYNGEKYIKKQIESIINQLTSDDELIISDDGSMDDTLSIINGFNDSRIKVVTNPFHCKDRKSFLERFRSATKNFENALKNASGDFIFLSDQDDIWTDNKVEITLNYLRKHDLVISDYILVDENDNTISGINYKRKKTKGFISNLIATPYIGCGMAFSKKILINSLPFPKNLFAHDMWIGFVAQFSGKVVFIDHKLFYHRRHGQNSSYSFEKSKNSLFFKISYRLNFLFLILFRYSQLVFKKPNKSS
jgi:glycosyltransferase involved in cell wall biosynthesis